jgi:hypothetical protein
MKKLCLLFWMLTSAVAQAAEGGFLFATFKGEATPMTEQVYFAISTNGRHWEALNGGEPVLVSQIGEKGVRDPFLIRSHEGDKTYLIATDLSINRNHNWRRAVREGSKSLVVWESEDLVRWSEPRLVKVAPDDAGCTWAPEAVYDRESGEYLVFWASTTGRDDFAKHRIWASRTRDFRAFGEPFIYIEKPRSIIDTTIVHEGGTYYRFSKDETTKAMTMEASQNLMGPWRDVPDFSLATLTGYEGPACFLLERDTGGAPGTWCLLLDHYSRGAGYQTYFTQNLSAGQFKRESDFSFPFRFRHGSVLPISTTELQALRSAFGKSVAR